MRSICIFLAVCTSSFCFAQTKKSWTWWAPPKTISHSDRLGYTASQIIAMGKDGWYELAYKQDSTMDDVDWEQIVLGKCFAERNDRLLRNLPPRESRLLKSVRDEMFYFGMACIAVETSLAGGGTYGIHSPKELYVRNERRLGDMIRAGGMSKPKPNLDKIIYSRIIQFRTLDIDPGANFGIVGSIDQKAIHRYGRYAAHHFHRLMELVNKLDSRRRDLVLTTMKEWALDYLDVRGAAELLKKHRTLPSRLQ